jgi:DNA-binding SARP family transcriptional activator/tetratricopeptide (TPR) repeat protein
MSRVRIHLLGRCEIEVDGTAIPAGAWRRRRATDLMKLVALAPGHALPREQVMEALWPDADPELSANNLHRALYDLRQVLGGPFVHPDKGVIRLDEAWVDVDQLITLCDAGDPGSLEAAVALYRGDLCPDDPYADSLDGPRQSLRRRFTDACLRLARHRLAIGDHAGAAMPLRRLLEVDPDDQEAARLLVRTQAPPQQRRVETEGARAARRLLGTAEPAPVRGRAADLAAVDAFVASEGGVLFVTGEAGVGKSRVAVEGTRVAADRGAVVLAGVALETHAGASYGPFVEMWSDRARTDGRPAVDHPFAALLPSPATDAGAARLALFLAVERSLDAIAGDRPTLLVIDDVHLADESSLDLVHHLARASRGRRLHLLCTCRDAALQPGTPVHRLFTRLHRDRLVTRLSLSRLDAAATLLQLADLLGAERAATLAPSIFALCNGNPFFTEEMAAGHRDGAAGVPEELGELVRDRVAALGREAEALLIAAAATGERFGFEEAAAAASLTVDEALAALDRARQDRLIDESEPGYRFRHALTREALYGALTLARRQHLHRKIAESLQQQGAAPARLAFHFRAGGALDRALPHLVAAGRQAERQSGLREAVAFYDEALAALTSLGRPDEATRFELESSLGRVWLALGDLDQAVQHHAAAAALAPDGAARARAHRGAAMALIMGGRLGEATAHVDAAVKQLGGPDGDDPDHPGMVTLHQARALLHWCQGQFPEAQARSLESLRAAQRHGDRAGETRACELLVLCSHGMGDWQAGVGWEERRSALAGHTLDLGELFDVHLCLWEMFLHDPAGWPRARQMLSVTEGEARRMGAERILALCRCVGGTLESLEQQPALAERSLKEAAELFRRTGIASGEAASMVRLGELFTRLGRVDEGRAILHDTVYVSERATMRSHVLVRLYAAIAGNHRASGQLEAARLALREGAATEARWGRCMSCSRFLAAAAEGLENTG